MRQVGLKVDNAAWLGQAAPVPLREIHGAACAHAATAEASHLALFYGDSDDYVSGVMDFLAPGLQAAEPVAVAVPRPRAELLAGELGRTDIDVQFLDMWELGRNPARIIPAVLTMLERHQGRTLHYIGEPVWPGRSRAEIQEATRHEALINLAWPGAAIRVLCPYDAGRLDDSVLRDAEMTHPWLWRDGSPVRSDAYGGAIFPAGTDNALDDPPADAGSIEFGLRDLATVRALVGARARAAGVTENRIEDLIIAVNEVATNAIKYAAEGGRLWVWSTSTEVICQLEDQGHMTDPLVGRRRPVAGTEGGIGLWMVNQLCDLVEVRTVRDGTTIRIHMRIG